MSYYIELKSIGIDNYKTKLAASPLLPSRMILKNKIDERFEVFKNFGIKNVQELQQFLKKKSNWHELSKNELLTDEYLTILLRELNSIQPKPNKIKEFIGIDPEVVAKLEKAGLTDTAKLYNVIQTNEKRNNLAQKTGISPAEIFELTCLTDLSRIKWTGPTFARMLFDAGINSVEKASKADYTDLHKIINQLNKERNYFKGQIGLNDMKLFVDAAKDVPLDIEY
jgi:hypothetical protein